MVHGDLPWLWGKEQGARGQHHVAHMTGTYEDAVIWEFLLCWSENPAKLG